MQPLSPDPGSFIREQNYNAKKRELRLQAVLFILTIVTTWAVGGWIHSLALLSILLCHEMGHYFAARVYQVSATLPYFLPSPSVFGTFGAFIKMQGVIPNRRALFDIGIMGPAAGLVIALPVTIVGIKFSEIVTTASLNPASTLPLGDSLLFNFLVYLIHGPMPAGSDILLHPAAFAGWAGLFVTALNLLPMGQLDGGHIVYAMLRQRSRGFYYAVFAIMLILSFSMNHQWSFFLILVFFLIGLKHPPTLNDDLPLGKARTIYGILALIFLLLTFPPTPFKVGH